MRVDFGKHLSKSDEVQQYLRLRRVARAAAGAVVIASIGVLMWGPSASRDSWDVDLSAAEMQRYSEPDNTSLITAPAPVKSDRPASLDGMLHTLDGVIAHG